MHHSPYQRHSRQAFTEVNILHVPAATRFCTNIPSQQSLSPNFTMASISSQGKRKDAMADHVDGYVIIDQPKRQRQSETTQASRPSARVAALTEGDNSVTDIGNGTTNLIDKYGPSAPYVASINPSDIIPNKATSFSLQNNGHESIATPQASNEGFTNYQLLQLAGKAPPVWAKTRSALCDAVDYFKMHDGGNYNKRGITYGILLDGADSIRDYIDGTVIITTMYVFYRGII